MRNRSLPVGVAVFTLQSIKSRIETHSNLPYNKILPAVFTLQSIKSRIETYGIPNPNAQCS